MRRGERERVQFILREDCMLRCPQENLVSLSCLLYASLKVCLIQEGADQIQTAETQKISHDTMEGTDFKCELGQERFR